MQLVPSCKWYSITLGFCNAFHSPFMMALLCYSTLHEIRHMWPASTAYYCAHSPEL